MSNQETAKRPYRVIVWGPGIVGSAVIREILKKPELELVGVLAYNPEKDGKDVGDMLGISPLGVRMTTDQEAVLALAADVVLYTPFMSAKVEIDSEATNIACRLLESGKHVITSIGWWYPAFHSKALEEKLAAACRKGKSCLHSTGINPGLLNERLVLALTGASTSISSILVQEVSNNSTIESADMLRGIGYGLPLTETPYIEGAGDRAYAETLALTCALLGLKVDRVESEKRYFTARKDHALKAFTVPKGSRAGINFLFHAIVDGKRFMTLEELWYIDPLDLHPGMPEGDYYSIVVEGEPVSVKCQFELMASAVQNIRFREGDPTMPGYYATAVPMIQAIPVVCSAPPGIVYPRTFGHYYPDLRNFNGPLVGTGD
jgi:2,4-diaminopentanoate dehydrogenase